LARRHLLERDDEIPVGALRLPLAALERAEDFLDAIDGRENQRHCVASDGEAVAKSAHQRLGRVGERLQARQAQEAAGSLDCVDETKNVVEDSRVVRILLETDQLDVDHVEGFMGLGQELAQQFVHQTASAPGGLEPPSAFREPSQFVAKPFKIGCLVRVDSRRRSRCRPRLPGCRAVNKSLQTDAAGEISQPAVMTTCSPSIASTILSPQLRASRPA
jgi:hypothetical protein